MWYSRISKLATSSISKRFTCQTHPTLNRNACFSSLKSPSISSKNGYTNYSNNLYLVKHYHKSGVHKWYKKLLKTTRNTYKYYDQQTQKVISSPRVGFAFGFAILKRIIFPLFSVCAGLVIVGVYVSFSEKIPYTNRTHIVFAPSYFDKIAGDFFLHQKVQLKILSKEHPDSVRVKMIGEQIVQALESDLKALKNENVSIDHLKGLIWEFVVVDQPIGGAGSLPGGKILVSTDLLKELKSDAEIATIIGHQVGHIVARHGANAMNMTMLVFQTKVFLELAGMAEILAKIVDYNPHGASNWIKDLFDYPKRQRQESEADHIGLLVMASAGYDPQVAPKVYEIFEKYESSGTDNFHIYPSAKKRAEKLARGNVMKDASSIYSKVIKTRKINDFKDFLFWY